MKKASTKAKQNSKSNKPQPDLKPYGFCCNQDKDPRLRRPNVDPTLQQVVLDAGGPNLTVKIEESDKTYFPPPAPKKRKVNPNPQFQ